LVFRLRVNLQIFFCHQLPPNELEVIDGFLIILPLTKLRIDAGY